MEALLSDDGKQIELTSPSVWQVYSRALSQMTTSTNLTILDLTSPRLMGHRDARKFGLVILVAIPN